MKAYATTSGNVNGAFPLTLAKNSSTGTATDGTPWVQDYVNDLWPLLQGLMDRVGMTPSGSVEAYVAVGSGSAAGLGNVVENLTQQHLLSLQRNFRMPGELIQDFLNTTAQATRRAFLLTGTVVDCYLYPDLAFNVWVGSANNASAPYFYTTSDAAGTTRAVTGFTVAGVTMGRYLVLPDCRGLSPIGLGANAKNFAVNGSAYTGGASLGAYLQEKLHGHYHGIFSSTSTGGGLKGPASEITTYQLDRITGSGYGTGSPISDGTNGLPPTGAYTRTPGFAVNMAISF